MRGSRPQALESDKPGFEYQVFVQQAVHLMLLVSSLLAWFSDLIYRNNNPYLIGLSDQGKQHSYAEPGVGILGVLPGD